MKKLFYTLGFILSLQLANAQDLPIIDLGVKVGGNVSWQRNSPAFQANLSSRLGIVGGLWLQVKIPVIGLYVQPEVILSQSGFNQDSRTLDTLGNDIGNTNFLTKISNIDIPVLIGQKIKLGALKLRIQAGPVFISSFSEVVDIDSPLASFSADITNIRNFRFGLQSGLALDFGRIHVDARYHHEFSRIYDFDITLGPAPSERLSILQFSVGYKIF